SYDLLIDYKTFICREYQQPLSCYRQRNSAIVPLSVTTIVGYHAHIYYDPQNPEDLASAQHLRKLMEEKFAASFGRWRDVPVGPHPSAMFQVAFSNSVFPELLPWLMLNCEGRSILVHPETGHDLDNHSLQAVWLGEKLALKLDNLKNS
ncbi:MAG: DOPA 4,5-dioxygenase family protein, partial [Sneathiella sp.]